MKSFEVLNSWNLSGGRFLQASRAMRATSLRSDRNCSVSMVFFMVYSSCSWCSGACSGFSSLPKSLESQDRFGVSSYVSRDMDTSFDCCLAVFFLRWVR